MSGSRASVKLQLHGPKSLARSQRARFAPSSVKTAPRPLRVCLKAPSPPLPALHGATAALQSSGTAALSLFRVPTADTASTRDMPKRPSQSTTSGYKCKAMVTAAEDVVWSLSTFQPFRWKWRVWSSFFQESLVAYLCKLCTTAGHRLSVNSQYSDNEKRSLLSTASIRLTS